MAPRARAVRLALVLGLDAILVGVGIALIMSYFDAREHARDGARGRAAAQPLSTGSTVEILAPTQVASTEEPPPSAPGEPSARSTRSRSRPADRVASRARTPEPGATPTPAAPSDSAAPEPQSDRVSASGPNAPVGDRVDPVHGAEPADSADVMAGAVSEADMEMLTRKVAGVVNDHRSQFERCSRQVAKASGPVQGNVVIRFAIRSDGRAADVRASENTTGSDRLAACLVAQFQSWSFPEHGGVEPVAFLWPLVFKAPQ